MNTQQLISKAKTSLALANEELNRPEEDVITLAACQHIKQCVYCLLKAFLLQNGMKTSKDVPLSLLISECKKASSDFSKIDFSSVRCRNLAVKENEILYCLSLYSVKKCMEVANEVEKIISRRSNQANGNLN